MVSYAQRKKLQEKNSFNQKVDQALNGKYKAFKDFIFLFESSFSEHFSENKVSGNFTSKAYSSLKGLLSIHL